MGDVVWTVSDITNALMAVPNIIVVLLLSGMIARETKHYVWDKNLEESDETPIPVLSRSRAAVFGQARGGVRAAYGMRGRACGARGGGIPAWRRGFACAGGFDGRRRMVSAEGHRTPDEAHRFRSVRLFMYGNRRICNF